MVQIIVLMLLCYLQNSMLTQAKAQLLQGIQPTAGSGKAISQQETLLRNMAANANNTYSVLAQSLIAAHYAEPFDKKPLAPPKTSNSHNAKSASICLFPNPANTMVQIYMSVYNEDAPAQLYVADMQGRVINQLPLTQPQLTLQTAQYPNGIYMLCLKTANGAVYTQKLAVIR
ncbi:T9SS C-terminal target domain-containing protein [Sphingobacteriales bacterium UPWRP_1]|nr:T9SS C-terminal target domain-containing protein [Sphingobacteriales bacterium UPWRP_1]